MTFLCPPADNGRNIPSSVRRLRPESLIVSILTFAICLAFVVTANAAVYTGTNTGAVPDGGPGNHVCGTPRNVQFAVSGFAGGIGSVSVNFTGTIGWIGDWEVSLIAPDNTTHLLFSRIGVNSLAADDWGDNANFNSTYTFNDLATSNIWTVAASSALDGFNIPSGSYRTQAAGPHANDSPGPGFTSMNATFAPINPANINGTWTLRFRDCASDYPGSVSAAQLTILPTLAGDATLAGRVVTASGAGLRNAVITVYGGNMTQPRVMSTGTFGHYRFDGLDAGQTYVVSVSAKRYTFNSPTMLVSLDDNLSEVDFVSNQ